MAAFGTFDDSVTIHTIEGGGARSRVAQLGEGPDIVWVPGGDSPAEAWRAPVAPEPVREEEPVEPEELPEPESEPETADVSAPPEATPARAVESPPPAYPALARRMGWEGSVTCRLAIAADGRVTSVVVETSSGHDLLDEAAVDSLERWRFEPATEDGRAVAWELVHTVTFRLTD